MGIDTKSIQDFMRGVVRFSMDGCYRCLQKHPFVSGVVMAFFLLYLFIPSVFNILVYSSPVIVCIAVSIKIYSITQQSKSQYALRVDDKSSFESKSLAVDHHVVSRIDDKPIIRSHMSRRRNFKEKNKEWDGNLRKGVMEEKGHASLDHGESSSQNAFVAQNIQSHDDLMCKTNLDKEKGSYSLDRGESSSRNASAGEDIQVLDQNHSVLCSQNPMFDLISGDCLVEQSEKFNICGGGGEVEEESSDDAEDEDEEGAQEDRNKEAVEWTADDQQNLMDLGDSELERNKRLESLIARRRARKLFKMALEKRAADPESTSPGRIAPISIMRNNLFNALNSHDAIESLQMPGSAPSVLLPTRNPFDIPYDPSEERPNLMADSFQQEFSAAHQKDMFFCRHESFCWGPSFSVESQQDHHDSNFGPYASDRRPEEGRRFSRFRMQSDMSAHDELIDDLMSEEGQALFRILSASDLAKAGSQAPKQVKESNESKREEDKEPGNVMAETKGETESSLDVDSRSADRSEIQLETDSVRDNSSEPCSLASSEASELSFQGNISANIENLEPKADKFHQKLSDRVEKSLTFLVPESVGFNGSSYDSIPSGIERPRMDERFFYRDKLPCHSPVYSIASDLQVEVSEAGSPPMPIDGTLSPVDAESSYDGDVEKEITSGSDEIWGASSHLSGVEENELRSREVNEVNVDDVLDVGFSAMKQNLQDPVPPSTLPEQVAEQYMRKTSPLSTSRTDYKISENVEQVMEEVRKSSNFSDALPPKIPQKALLSLNDSVAVNPEELADSPEMLAEEESIARNVDKSEDIGDTSKTIEGKDNEKSIQDIKEEQNISEVGVSGVNQSSDIPTMPASQPILVAEQFPSGSSSCPSPRSVLPGKIPKDQIPLSHFDPQIQMNVPLSVVDDTVSNNSMDEEPPESLIQNDPSTNSNSGKSKEPSVEVVEGESESLIDPVAAIVLSEPAHKPRPDSVEVPGTMVKEEETRNYLGQSTREENQIENATDPVVNEKEHKETLQSAKGSDDEYQHQKGKLTENEAIVGPSNSIDGNESSSVIKGREDIRHVPAADSSGGNLEATEASRGESNTSEASTKPSIPAAETVVREAQSIPLPQKSTEKVDINPNVNETLANETSNKKSLLDEENVTDQTMLGKSSAEVDIVHSDGVANEMSNKKSLIEHENFGEKQKPGKATAEVDIIMHNVNETVANETSNKKSLIDQENTADQPKQGKGSDNLKTIEDIKIEPDDQTDKLAEHSIIGDLQDQ